MIISASRRTDIPTYYSEWLFRRLKEEYVLVRNPMNPHQISRISLSPEVVDGIVFWTKNPVPMLGRLSELERYPYYVQFTLNAYDRDAETNLPSKNHMLIPAFQQMSREAGRQRVVWRYDPIFFNDRYTVEYHCRYFKALAARLGAYTETCVISFLDFYRNTARNMQSLNLRQPSQERLSELLLSFSETAREYGFRITTCAEAMELSQFGISHGCCIDKERLERIGGCHLTVEKDKNQRPECGCFSSVDIGAYDTCQNGCLYCYANHSQKILQRNIRQHNPASPLLFGEIGADDVIKERKLESRRDGQMRLSDIVSVDSGNRMDRRNTCKTDAFH